MDELKSYTLTVGYQVGDHISVDMPSQFIPGESTFPLAPPIPRREGIVKRDEKSGVLYVDWCS